MYSNVLFSTLTHTHTHPAYTHVQRRARAHTRTHTQTRTHTLSLSHTHTHTRAHTHAHAQVVKVAENRWNGKPAAVKILPKRDSWGKQETTLIEREIDIMQDIDHPNCISM